MGARAEPVEEGVGKRRLDQRLVAFVTPTRLLILVVLIGGLLRLYRYDSLSLWVDEGLTLGFGRLPWDTVLGLHGAYETHPPLYFVLVKVAGLFAPELIAGRLVSVAAGTVTLPVFYLLGAMLIGSRGALVAAGVLALSPLHIWYSQEARPYALTMLAVCLAYLALAGFHKTLNRRWCLLYGMAVAVSLYSNYSSIYALAPQGLLLIYLPVAHGKRALWIWLAGIGGVLGFLSWVPQLIGTMQSRGTAVEDYLGVSMQKVGYSVLSIVGLGGQGSYFWGTSPTAWERWPDLQWGMLAALLVVCGVGVAALGRRGLFGLLCAVGLFAGTIVVCAGISLISAGYAERTVIFALLGWALVAGAIAGALLARGWRWAGASALAMLLLLGLVSLWAMYAGGDKQHWRELAHDAAELARSGETLLLYPSVTGVLLDAYERHEFDDATVIPDYGELPDVARPESETKTLWLVYIDTGGLARLQEQLVERGYVRLEHRYYWNPLWIDRYEASDKYAQDLAERVVSASKCASRLLSPRVGASRLLVR